MKLRTILRLVGAAVALGLFVFVLRAAGPGEIWKLIRTSRGEWMAAAGAAALLTIVLRGLRLVFLMPPKRLGPVTAVWVAAGTQAAAMFVPARLGELALPWLLHRLAGWDRARGLTILLAARLLDLATLALWAAFGVVVLWGFEAPFALVGVLVLVIPATLLPVAIERLHRIATGAAARGGLWPVLAEKTERIQAAMVEVRQRPLRLAGAAASSFAMWMSVWLMTWLLLRAMGVDWSPTSVVAGSALASLANLLPINLVANIGTLEAGWTAAFTALGYPVEQAAATGVSAHLWALIFVAVAGLVAWLMVIARR